MVDNYDHDEILTMINDCAQRESKLNDWERGFIASVGEMADKGIRLTVRQLDTLNNIWQRIT